MSSNLVTLGKNLTKNTAKVHIAAAISVEQQAEFSTVSLSTIKRIEKARKARRTYRPMLSTVVKLADLAGVGIDQYVKTLLTFQ